MITTRILGLLTGLALGLLAGAAVAQDSPEVQATLDPWLDRVVELRTETQSLVGMWENAARLPRPETTDYVETTTAFVETTEATSAHLREVQPGIDAACILHGIGLDVTNRLESLTPDAGPEAAIEVLNGIDRLLFEGLLIFGREQEAELSGAEPIRVAYAQIKFKPGHKTTQNDPQDLPCDAEVTPAK